MGWNLVVHMLQPKCRSKRKTCSHSRGLSVIELRSSGLVATNDTILWHSFTVLKKCYGQVSPQNKLTHCKKGGESINIFIYK